MTHLPNSQKGFYFLLKHPEGPFLNCLKDQMLDERGREVERPEEDRTGALACLPPASLRSCQRGHLDLSVLRALHVHPLRVSAQLLVGVGTTVTFTPQVWRARLREVEPLAKGWHTKRQSWDSV